MMGLLKRIGSSQVSSVGVILVKVIELGFLCVIGLEGYEFGGVDMIYDLSWNAI